MKKLIAPIFKTTFCQRESKVFLSFIFFPLLLWGLTLLPDGAFQLDVATNSSWLKFFCTCLTSQIQLVLPIVTLSLCVVTTFHQEISFKVLYLYKDIDRVHILKVRILSYLLLYVFYITGSALVSFIVYFVLLKGTVIKTVSIFPQATTDWTTILTTFISTISINLMIIWMSSWLAIKYRQTLSITIILLMIVFYNMQTSLGGVAYLFPNHYLAYLSQIGFINVILIISSMTIFYCSLSSYLSFNTYKELEL